MRNIEHFISRYRYNILHYILLGKWSYPTFASNRSELQQKKKIFINLYKKNLSEGSWEELFRALSEESDGTYFNIQIIVEVTSQC